MDPILYVLAGIVLVAVVAVVVVLVGALVSGGGEGTGGTGGVVVRGAPTASAGGRSGGVGFMAAHPVLPASILTELLPGSARPMRHVLTLVAQRDTATLSAALIGAAVSASGAEEPEKSCANSTYEIVECQKAELAALDKRLNAAYGQALQDAQSASTHWLENWPRNCWVCSIGAREHEY